MVEGADRTLTKRCIEPLARVRDEGPDILITADLPCIKKEDIKVNLTEDTVEIWASIAESRTFSSWGGWGHTIEFASFRKSFTLPAKVKPEGARARFKGGILEIRVPKKLTKFEVLVE